MTTATDNPAEKPASSGAPWFVAAAAAVLLVGFVLYKFPPELQKVSFVQEGSPVPAFELPSADGSGKISWDKDLAGRVVLINFWATWCPPCLEEMPAMDRLHRKLEGEGLTVLAVSEDENAPLAANYARTEKLGFPVVYDDDHRVATQFGTFKYPETYIVGRDGLVKKKLFGPSEWDSEQAVEYFRGLLASGTQAAPGAPEIPSDPSAARSPEREVTRERAEKRGGAPGTVEVE